MVILSIREEAYSIVFLMALKLYTLGQCGTGSSVGIATGFGLDGLGIESQWGARFSAPVQTGPGAHSASCTLGTRSFTGG